MIGLSKSALDVFKSCPRCFWLDKNGKLKRPEGIKASILDGIDDCMKQVGEYHALTGSAAPYLAMAPGAKPYHDRARLKKFMSWRTFQATIKAGKHEALIWGQLDDLIEWPDGRVSPWDFKSNGKKRDWAEYTMAYNTLQGDMYDILLPAQGLITTGEAYFTYSWPVVVDGVMGFDFETVKMQTNVERAIQVIEAAIDCLLGDEPVSSPFCDYCAYVNKRAYRK
jgi:hypothetical protein